MNTPDLNVVLNVLALLVGGGTLGIFLRYRLGLKKLASGDVADIRDHYAKEVSALREKLNAQEDHFRKLEMHWREMLESSDRRHQECEEARLALRGEIEALHSDIRGLRDQLRRYSADAVLILEAGSQPPSVKAPESLKAARRIIEMGGDK